MFTKSEEFESYINTSINNIFWFNNDVSIIIREKVWNWFYSLNVEDRDYVIDNYSIPKILSESVTDKVEQELIYERLLELVDGEV